VQNAGTHSFSIGVTEVLNTNLLIELSADDIEYVYQRLILLFYVTAYYKLKYRFRDNLLFMDT
jgi:hypothetical protein